MSRKNRLNNGYLGTNKLLNDYGSISVNKQYLQSEMDQWFPPSSWLSLPGMTEGDQKMAGLYAIFPGGSGASGITSSGNFLSFAILGCTYTVDWGNGITSIFSSGQTAQYNYNFSGISSAIDPNLGYKQVIVQAYPSTAGNTFSFIDFFTPYVVPGITLPLTISDTFLYLKICSNSLTGISLGTSQSTGKVFSYLEAFEYVGESKIESLLACFKFCRSLKKIIGTEWTKNCKIFSQMLLGCINLKSIPPLNTSSGINFDNMFSQCRNLKYVPFLNTSSGITFSSMFSNCSQLESIPALDTSSGKDFNSMFNQSRSLKYVPFLNTSGGLDFTLMFGSNSSLRSVPLLDLSSGITFTNMFSQCESLQTIPPFNMSSGVNFNNTFSLCTSLTTVGLINTSSGIVFSNMFSNCTALETIPLINVSNGTNFTSMFSSSTNLKSIPLLNVSKGITFEAMFSSCTNLTTIPLLNTTSGRNFNLIFNNCGSLKVGALNGTTSSISYSGCNLSAAALNDIFTYLSTSGSGKTVTITGNWGASGCNRLIATAKGWAVSG